MLQWFVPTRAWTESIEGSKTCRAAAENIALPYRSSRQRGVVPEAPEARRRDRFVPAYLRLKILAAVVLCGYAVAAVAVKAAFRHEREVFPLFSWSLYSTVPREAADYGMRILAVEGRRLHPPLFFEDAKSYFPHVHQAQLIATVQFLGRALDSGNTEAVKRYRRLLERHHLRGRGAVRYEIVRRRYNTLARWSSGEVKSVSTVATLSTNEAAP